MTIIPFENLFIKTILRMEMNCHKKQMFTKTVNLDTFLEDLDRLKGLEGKEQLSLYSNLARF